MPFQEMEVEHSIGKNNLISIFYYRLHLAIQIKSFLLHICMPLTL